MEDCTIGSRLSKECHLKSWSKITGIRLLSDFTAKEKKILEFRTGLQGLHPESTICFHHEAYFLKKYPLFQKQCLNLFGSHKAAIKKGLSTISLDYTIYICEKYQILLTPGQKLCPNCKMLLSKLPLDSDVLVAKYAAPLSICKELEQLKNSSILSEKDSLDPGPNFETETSDRMEDSSSDGETDIVVDPDYVPDTMTRNQKENYVIPGIDLGQGIRNLRNNSSRKSEINSLVPGPDFEQETRLDDCTIGSSLSQECHLKFWTKNRGLYQLSNFSAEKYNILKLRTGLQDLYPESTICFHHEAYFLKKYPLFQRQCCNLFEYHKSPIYKSLATISLDYTIFICEKYKILLIPGQKLCPTCKGSLSKLPLDSNVLVAKYAAPLSICKELEQLKNSSVLSKTDSLDPGPNFETETSDRMEDSSSDGETDIVVDPDYESDTVTRNQKKNYVIPGLNLDQGTRNLRNNSSSKSETNSLVPGPDFEQETRLDDCTIGSSLSQECHQKVWTRNSGLHQLSSFSAEEYNVLKLRTGLQHVYPESTICSHHEAVYFTKYIFLQKNCCDPFGIHKVKIKRALHTISVTFSKQSLLKCKMSLIPGQKLCINCNRKLKLVISNTKSVLETKPTARKPRSKELEVKEVSTGYSETNLAIPRLVFQQKNKIKNYRMTSCQKNRIKKFRRTSCQKKKISTE